MYRMKCLSVSSYAHLIKPEIHRKLFIGSNQILFLRNAFCNSCFTKYLNNFSNSLFSKTFKYTSNITFLRGISRILKSHSCGQLTSNDVGSRVRLRGFLQYQRMGQFGVLRDSFGKTQLIIKDEALALELKDTPYESYIEAVGEVVARPEKQIRKSEPTGEIEVLVEEFQVLNRARKDMPFLIRDQNQPTESLAAQYRYLDLRRPTLQSNLRFRSKMGKIMRDFLQDVQGFVEITTPTLSVATPGGAQEFVVPSRTKNQFYSLVQSPQMYKQLAVIGGFERYFQFAVCYRDEGSKPDRQPEFMQLDIEVSDMTALQIQNLLEELLRQCWPEGYPPLPVVFPTMGYDEAMRDYGVDKPDTRFEWKISDIGEISAIRQLFDLQSSEDFVAKAFVVPQGKNYIKKSHRRKWKDLYQKNIGCHLEVLTVKENFNISKVTGQGLPTNVATPITNSLRISEGDSIVVAVGKESNVLKLLGKLRISAAEVLEDAGVMVRDPRRFEFLWVRDFPLFEWDDDQGKLVSCHHPFTAPAEGHEELMLENPLLAKSQHYDFVLNGCEIAGGSVRIHDSDRQRQVLQTLGINPQPLEFLLEALSCGAPPHGGIALGFDRYISILCGAKSIREVMAFPKSTEGRCPMSGAPAPISPEEKILYHFQMFLPVVPVENDTLTTGRNISPETARKYLFWDLNFVLMK